MNPNFKAILKNNKSFIDLITAMLLKSIKEEIDFLDNSILDKFRKDLDKLCVLKFFHDVSIYREKYSDKNKKVIINDNKKTTYEFSLTPESLDLIRVSKRFVNDNISIMLEYTKEKNTIFVLVNRELDVRKILEHDSHIINEEIVDFIKMTEDLDLSMSKGFDIKKLKFPNVNKNLIKSGFYL